jgi:SAM-dependent methyltransferase
VALNAEDSRPLREQNRRSWETVVAAHESHRGDLSGFLRRGGSTLFPEDLGLLGGPEGVAGKRLAHLMCNTGGDTLSLARLGADATGVDISKRAVESARRLSRESGIPATFVQSDLYDWLERKDEHDEPGFDLIYASYGVVCWLSDLDRWAAGVYRRLVPGGCLALVDFHPAAMMLDADWRLANDYYSGGEPLRSDAGVGDYVGESEGGLTPAGHETGVQNFENPEPCYLFRWGLGEVVTALTGPGMILQTLEEYPYANGERQFKGMRELPGRRMSPPQDVPRVPLMYGISAAKPS